MKWVNKNTKFIEREFLKAIDNGILEFLEEMKEDMEYATSSWKHKPQFQVSKRQKAVTTRSKRFLWVNRGTSVRWSRVSRNWQSKSQPMSLTPGSGRGRILKKVDKSKPGIVARNFDEAAAIKRAPRFEPILTKHVSRRANAIFV
jgi:hypothetical protein